MVLPAAQRESTVLFSGVFRNQASIRSLPCGSPDQGNMCTLSCSLAPHRKRRMCFPSSPPPKSVSGQGVPLPPGYPIHHAGIHISSGSQLPWLLSPVEPSNSAPLHDLGQHTSEQINPSTGFPPPNFPEQLWGAKVLFTSLNRGHWQRLHYLPLLFPPSFPSLFFVPLTFALPISQYPQQVQLIHSHCCWSHHFPSAFDLPAERETASLFCFPPR